MDYYLRRLWQAIFTLWAVITITFVLYRLMPGGPLDVMTAHLIDDMGGAGSAEDMEHINNMVQAYTRVHPEQPLYVAYYEYMRDMILYQEFGRSIWYGDPVFEILFAAMPWSVLVSVYGLVLGYTANLILGAFMAYREGTRFDAVSSLLCTFLNSVPYYVGGILMLSWLAFEFGWFPTGGRYPNDASPGFNAPFIIGVIHHATLPIISGFIVGFGGAALEMRGNSIRIMGENYLKVARLRGLSESRIAIRYVGRNAILPLYTGFMIGITAIFSSSIIMEQIFTYRGMGWYTHDALVMRDYPLLMGVLILFSTITVIGILLADLTYGMIDPRASDGNNREAY